MKKTMSKKNKLTSKKKTKKTSEEKPKNFKLFLIFTSLSTLDS